jgi:hypothetical protein
MVRSTVFIEQKRQSSTILVRSLSFDNSFIEKKNDQTYNKTYSIIFNRVISLFCKNFKVVIFDKLKRRER